MIQVGFINSEGEIEWWTSPGDDAMYTEGQSYDGYEARHFAYDADIQEYQKTHVWTGSEWQDRVWKDSRYHKWQSGAWVYQTAQFMSEVRGERVGRLFECDWTQNADSPLTDEQKASFVTYRTALRDFPSTLDLSSEPIDIQALSWPTQPTT